MVQAFDWAAGGEGAGALFWNPGAISFLAELLLALVMGGYLAVRVFREWRQGRLYPPTVLLTILMAAAALGLLTSMCRVLVAGGWLSYAMPWSSLDGWATLSMPWARPFAGVVCAALLLFAYQFPGPLRGARRETIMVGGLLALLIAMESVFAVMADMAILARQAWWRADWITAWMNVAMLWTAIVFWRQLATAHGNAAGRGWRARFGPGFSAIWRRSANREAKASRAFVILTLLPITHTAALIMPIDGEFASYPIDIFICWSMLAQLLGLGLVLVGYLPERSSFLFKLTAIGLAVLLAAINGAAWMIAAPYSDQFRAPEMVASGKSLRYDPTSRTEYFVQPQVFLTEPALGQVIGPAGGGSRCPFRSTSMAGAMTSCMSAAGGRSVSTACRAPPTPLLARGCSRRSIRCWSMCRRRGRGSTRSPMRSDWC